jgi:predicted site-specific integrase-resolvase
VVYARVSSSDQRPDLDRQVTRVTEWATGRKLSVDRVVTEVGWLSVSDDESRARHTWDSNPS